jgi:arsenate reductase
MRREAGTDHKAGTKMVAMTIYHNPQCSNSRQALKIIQDSGVTPTVTEYLKTPLSKDQLKALIAKMGVAVKDVVRWKEKDTVAAAGISESASDEALLAAMVKFPILMNRPIVVTDKGAKLCRPSEAVASLL